MNSLVSQINGALLTSVRRIFQHVILHVTERCSLQCRTCFVIKRARDLSYAQAQDIAAKISPPRWLDIGGGEPFLHPDLPAICRLFPKSEITIPTNGQDPEGIMGAVKEISTHTQKRLTLALSIDGFETINDTIRGPGAYAKAMETFARLRSLPNLTLKINTVICNLNFEELIPFMRFIRELSPAYHSLLLLRGKPDDSTLRLPPLEELDRSTKVILEILGSYRFGNHLFSPLGMLKRRYQRYLWHVNLKTLKTTACQVPCKAPWLHRVIYPDGSVACCELMPPVGNILEQPIEEIESAMLEQFRKYEAQHGACWCTHNCNLGENILMHMPSLVSLVLGIRP